MSAADADVAPERVVYPTPQAFGTLLDAHRILFTPFSTACLAGTSLASRIHLHRHGPLNALTIQDLGAADAPALAGAGAFAFVSQVGDPGADLVGALARGGVSLVQRHVGPGDPDPPWRHRRMGSEEFLLSDAVRLKQSPVFSGHGATAPVARRRAVILLDLVQDFEILRPLLVRAAGRSSPFDLRVAVTERMVRSGIWAAVRQFISLHGIAWFTPIGASDITNALGTGKALLLTASESSAGAHAFGHTVCRAAPPRTLRVTMQHGHECIGLRHHRAHDIDFPHGVRFASDLVLTWSHANDLPDLHPGERDKCVAVGVIKAIAERASLLREQHWMAPPATTSSTRQRLLIAENLHSVRFRAPGRYQRFLRFIQAAQEDGRVELTVRSHPASRTLEKQRETNRMKFLDDMLRLDDLVAFDGFVSPPSTILFDSTLAGVPSAVWTDAVAAGEAVNYDGLPTVTDLDDWMAIAPEGAGGLAAMSWATRSTTSLNGAPAAWAALRRLFD